MKKQLDPTLSVRVPQHLIDAIELEAAARGLPRADYLRAVLAAVLRMGGVIILDAADIPPELCAQYSEALAVSYRPLYRPPIFPLYPPTRYIADPLGNLHEAEPAKGEDQ